MQGKYMWWSMVIVRPFFVVHSNFTYDSEAYDFKKLYFETLLEILVSSQFKLYTIRFIVKTQ